MPHKKNLWLPNAWSQRIVHNGRHEHTHKMHSYRNEVSSPLEQQTIDLFG